MLFKHYRHITTPVWLMAMVTFISRSGSMVLVFLPIYLAQQLHFSTLLIGRALACYGIGEIAGSYFGGRIADRLGFLITQSAALFFVGICYIALEFFNSYFLIAFTLFLIGFLSAAVRPTAGIVLSQFSTPQTRAQSFALNYQALNLGATIGPALGGLLAMINYAWLFRIDGLMNMIGSMILLVFFHGRKTQITHESNNTTYATSIWKDDVFLRFLLLIFIIGFCFFNIINAYPFFLKNNYHLTTEQIGYVLGLNGLLIVFFQMPVTHHFKSTHILSTIGLGGFLIGLGYFILPFYHGFYFALLSITLITLGEMLFVPSAFDHATQLSPPHARGTYLGLASICQASLPLTITPMISMAIYYHYGTNVLWLGIGALCMFAILLSKTSQ